jgi:DNA gyrase/topoisomerase IV subunit A
MRYPLVNGQGNFGSIDGDPPAAMRYTEARLQSLSDDMMGDLDKETVDFVPNYDETTEEPTVLPAPFPNLLVNGSAGIAVGMATNVPPHNLREVIDGCIWLIDNTHFAEAGTRLTTGEKLRNLIRLIPAPDFPTAGQIVGRQGAVQAYTTGRGSILMRARSGIETNKKGDKQSIVVTEIPHQVNKAKLIERDRRSRARKDHRRHFRFAGRIRSRRNADRHRAEARRGGGGHTQQPLQAHAVAIELRHHHARDRRRTTEGIESSGARRKLCRVSPRRGAPPHRVRAEEASPAITFSRG